MDWIIIGTWVIACSAITSVVITRRADGRAHTRHRFGHPEFDDPCRWVCGRPEDVEGFGEGASVEVELY